MSQGYASISPDVSPGIPLARPEEDTAKIEPPCLLSEEADQAREQHMAPGMPDHESSPAQPALG